MRERGRRTLPASMTPYVAAAMLLACASRPRWRSCRPPRPHGPAVSGRVSRGSRTVADARAARARGTHHHRRREEHRTRVGHVLTCGGRGPNRRVSVSRHADEERAQGRAHPRCPSRRDGCGKGGGERGATRRGVSQSGRLFAPTSRDARQAVLAPARKRSSEAQVPHDSERVKKRAGKRKGKETHQPGSKRAYSRPMLAPGTMPGPPTSAAPMLLTIEPYRLGMTMTSNCCGRLTSCIDVLSTLRTRGGRIRGSV